MQPDTQLIRRVAREVRSRPVPPDPWLVFARRGRSAQAHWEGKPQRVNVNALRILTLVLMFIVMPSARSVAQEQIVSKQDADRIFAFNKAQWNAYAKQVTHPEGWITRSALFEAGIVIAAYDPNTNLGLSVQPLYTDESGPPVMLIVGNYYPAGTFQAFPDSLRQGMERAARADLGPTYNVSISFQRTSPFGTALEVIEITISRAKK